MTITEIRALTGLNKTKFAALYGIPYRTLQDWESGKNKPPAYVELLLEKVVKYELLKSEDCVSRKAVLEIIEDCNSDGLKGIFCSYNDGERFKEYIKSLPKYKFEEKD